MFDGRLLSAMPLSEGQIQSIERRFTSLLGSPVRLSLHVDPSLLGGIRVEINGFVYDGSLQTQLQDVLRALQSVEED